MATKTNGNWKLARIRYDGCIPCDECLWVLDGDLDSAIVQFESHGDATFYFWL